MSLFGKLDAANIPSNPFFIEKGEYYAEVTNAFYKKRDDKMQLVIEYTINDDSSQYNDSRVSQYLDLPDENIDNETIMMLSAEEQRTVRRAMSAVKRTLCGNGRNKGLGIDAEDLNAKDWDPIVLKGTQVLLAIKNYGEDGTAVNWANVITDEDD